MAKREVVLRNSTQGRDHRSLVVRYTDDGGIDFEGFDAGPSVTAAWGSSSYEWHWTVAANDVPRVRALLAVPEGVDLLDHIAENCGADLPDRLQAAGIRLAFFNWVSFD